MAAYSTRFSHIKCMRGNCLKITCILQCGKLTNSWQLFCEWQRGKTRGERERWTPTIRKTRMSCVGVDVGVGRRLRPFVVIKSHGYAGVFFVLHIRVWGKHRVWALAHQKCTIDGAEKMWTNRGVWAWAGAWLGSCRADRNSIYFRWARERERESNCVTIVLEQN